MHELWRAFTERHAARGQRTHGPDHSICRIWSQQRLTLKVIIGLGSEGALHCKTSEQHTANQWPQREIYDATTADRMHCSPNAHNVTHPN
jgi:hypothetical protein